MIERGREARIDGNFVIFGAELSVNIYIHTYTNIHTYIHTFVHDVFHSVEGSARVFKWVF